MAFIQSLMVEIEAPSFEVCAMSTQAGFRPRRRAVSGYITQPEPIILQVFGYKCIIDSACHNNLRVQGIYTNGMSVTLVRQLSVPK